MHDLTATLFHSDPRLIHSDLVEGPSRLQNTIPCRWLYDERGPDLFEKIMGLETKRTLFRANYSPAA